MYIFPEHIICETSTIADGNMSFQFGKESEVVENRRKFEEKHGIDYKDHICMRCNHGTTITPVNWSNCGSCTGAKTQNNMIQAEVLVTQGKNLTLMLLTADCLPISFYDPVTDTLALAHLSRKTTACELVQKTIDFLRQHYSVSPENLLINIGPHIHKNSYKFELPLSEETPEQLTNFIEKKDGYVDIDLLSANQYELTESGVHKQNISISETDTATSPNHFSHYRSKQNPSEAEGRMATILMMN